jgi:Domain of unknown function (DUF6798)
VPSQHVVEILDSPVGTAYRTTMTPGELPSVESAPAVERFSAWLGALALCFAAASLLGVNRYGYGIDDQCITIPYMLAWGDPSLFQGDLLVEQREFYYTFLFQGLGALIRLSGWTQQGVFLLGTVASVAATFLAMGWLVWVAKASWRAAALGMLLLLFAKPALDGTFTLGGMLLTRTVAMPLLLFALGHMLRRQWVSGFALLGLTFLLHPLSAAHGLVIGCGMWWGSGRRDIGRLMRGIAAFFVLASPILVWRLSNAPAAFHPFCVDPTWMAILELRSANEVFPSAWSLRDVLPMTLSTLALLPCLRSLHAAVRGPLLWAVVAVLATIALGCVFTEVRPVPLVIQAHPFRMSKYLHYLAIVCVAHHGLRTLESSARPRELAILALQVAACLYGASFWSFGLPAVAVLGAVVFVQRWRTGRPLRRVAFAVGCVLVAAGSAGWGAWRDRDEPVPSARDPRWLDVQQWARTATRPDTEFVVPPNLMGFRVESWRCIYGDWKDGTINFYSPQFGAEWLRRMQALGYRDSMAIGSAAGTDVLADGYRRLAKADWQAVAAEIRDRGHRPLAVLFADQDSCGFPLLFGNDRFAVCDIGAR